VCFVNILVFAPLHKTSTSGVDSRSCTRLNCVVEKSIRVVSFSFKIFDHIRPFSKFYEMILTLLTLHCAYNIFLICYYNDLALRSCAYRLKSTGPRILPLWHTKVDRFWLRSFVVHLNKLINSSLLFVMNYVLSRSIIAFRMSLRSFESTIFV